MVCKLFTDGAAQVRSPVHTYAHLVREPFGTLLYTRLQVLRFVLNLFPRYWKSYVLRINTKHHIKYVRICMYKWKWNISTKLPHSSFFTVYIERKSISTRLRILWNDKNLKNRMLPMFGGMEWWALNWEWERTYQAQFNDTIFGKKSEMGVGWSQNFKAPSFGKRWSTKCKTRSIIERKLARFNGRIFNLIRSAWGLGLVSKFCGSISRRNVKYKI